MHSLRRIARGMVIVGVLLAAGVMPVLAVPSPLVTLDAPTTALVGNSFTFTVTFDNTGTTPGFGPFIDVILPSNGTDGPLSPDGVTFVDARLDGGPLGASAITQRTFPAPGGCVTHPFAVALNNVPLSVCGTPGDTLLTLRLPFGSFTSAQLPVEIEIEAQMDPDADLGALLRIRARGGFSLGIDERNNPCCDPSILQPPSSNSTVYTTLPVTPIALRAEKAISNVERETATGENFTQTYSISVLLAPNATVNNLRVEDTLHQALTFVSGSISAPVGCTATPPALPSTPLIVDCVTVTGDADPNTADLVIVYDVFVAQTTTSGTPVLNNPTWTANVTNAATVRGDFVTTDPGDGASVQATGGANAPVLAARAIAVQKSARVVIDLAPAGASPGDTLENTLTFQVSDYFAFENAVIADRISDGQIWDNGAPVLELRQHDVLTPAAGMAAANYSFTLLAPPVSPPALGEPPAALTQAVFRVSQELDDRGFSIGGDLLGACVNDTDSTTPPACGTFSGTEGVITYRTVIQDQYTFPSGALQSGDPSVDQGDVLSNSAAITADLVPPSGTPPPAASSWDSAVADTPLERGDLNKEVYQVRRAGSPTSPPYTLQPGDEVTFILRYSLRTSDVEDLVLTDYLPIPIFNAGLFVLGATVGECAAPGGIVQVPVVNTACLGTGDTFHLLPGAPSPTTAINILNNTISFAYGSYDNSGNPPSQIELYFTVAVQNRPFAGSLALTNTAQVSEASTQRRAFASGARIGFGFSTPVLVTHKGVVGSSGGTGVLVPPTAAPVPFLPPGDTTVPPFTGVITSGGLAGTPINSNIGFALPGDLLRFAIVVENTGTSGAFDIVVQDILPAGFRIPPSGLNLTIRRGNGDPLSFIAVDPADPIPLFGDGIQLVDPSSSEAACQLATAAPGSNIAVITYDLQVDPVTPIPSQLTNIGVVLSFSRTDNAPQSLVLDPTAYRNWSTVGVGTAVGAGDTAAATSATLAGVTMLPSTGELPCPLEALDQCR